MLRLALLLAVPLAAVGEGVAVRVSDFEVGADSTIKALGVHEWHGQLHTSAGLKNWVIV
jgi:hypothetical protein